MASVNALARELVFKIVYYGPGLGGKTTTLENLHATAKPEHRGKLVSLATPVDRTLYFDFLPVRLPPLRGMNIRLQLFTVPGQVYYNATRKLVLTGADGLVFVSDSQIARADANLESLENLRENLAEQGREIERVPLIFQHNKRDLPDLLAVEELDSILNPWGAPSIPTSAKTGMGLYEALEAISGLVLKAFETRLPELTDSELGASFEAIEGGLLTALRNASPSGPPDDIVVARLPDPSHTYSSLPPEALPDDPAAADAPADSLFLGGREPPPVRFSTSPPRTVVRALSFAELWPENEQDTVREIEAALAGAQYTRAIELSEALVSRALASAAGLLGSPEAPRDPAVVTMLLGLNGARFLSFRAIVREARAGTAMTGPEALTAFAFAIDARIARNSIG